MALAIIDLFKLYFRHLDGGPTGQYIYRLRLLSLAFHILNASSNCFDLIIAVYIYITY